MEEATVCTFKLALRLRMVTRRGANNGGFGEAQRKQNIASGEMMNNEKKKPHESGQPDGRYANYFEVGHNAFEFLFDFGQTYRQGKPAPLHTRIVTTPVYAKTLLGILQASIDQYEQLFGTIPGADK